MSMHDKLTFATTFNLSSRVITPNNLQVVSSIPNFAPDSTASIESQFAAISVMEQQEGSKSDAAKAVGMAMDKAALSFILSSSNSDSEMGQESQENGESTSESPLVAHECSMAPLTLEGATLARKGSKFCCVDGCTSRAKHAKRCWKHGGSVKCKVVNCINRAKSKGVCWSHGGGTVCSLENCDTIAVSNGFCWAHGGGKRCQVPNCAKPAYERTQNYCQTHFEKLSAGGTGAS